MGYVDGCHWFATGLGNRIKGPFVALHMSLPGPTLPTFAVQQVVGYLGYTGRAADVVATAAYDPEETFDHELSCNDESYNPLTVAAYSITSSAATSSVFGTVSPRALAALRLRTISTRVDCCTGRSAGFSPLRIRPT